MDPQNTHKKTILTHQIPTRKNFGVTKYLRKKKFWTHEIPTKARWHDGTKPTRPTIALEPRNVAHSFITQPAFTCSNVTIETLEQGVQYVQS